MTQLEDRIRTSLHATADQFTDERFVSVASTPKKRPGLRGIAVAAVAMASVAIAIGIPAVLFGGLGEPQPDVGSQDARGFPLVLVNVDQIGGDFKLTHAVREPAPIQQSQPSHLQVFGESEGQPTSDRIGLVTDEDGSDFFRGEAYLEAGWERISVPSGRAFVMTGQVASMVAWDPGNASDGPAVFGYATNLDPSLLVDVIRELTPAAQGWTTGFLPEGFTDLYAGPMYGTQGNTALLAWANDEGAEIHLTLSEVGQASLEHRLLSSLRFNVALVEEIGTDIVRGHDAVRIDYEDAVIYLWMETPSVEARLLVQGPSIDPGEAVDALHDADPATWDDLFQESPDVADGTTATTVAPTADTGESG